MEDPESVPFSNIASDDESSFCLYRLIHIKNHLKSIPTLTTWLATFARRLGGWRGAPQEAPLEGVIWSKSTCPGG